jgi:adenylyl-sulfate kinase
MKYNLPEFPFTIWLTGLSGSGKTTIANQLHQFFIFHGKSSYIIDGDILREGLCSDLTFSIEHRRENIRRAAEVASVLNNAGVISIVALISPIAADRENACNIIGAKRFAEIHVATPIEVCEMRDVKGLYRKARCNDIANFTGVSSPYECPVNPLVTIDSSVLDFTQTLDVILAALEFKFKPDLSQP